MECNHARLLLVLTPPHGNELESSEADALERHLAECSECGALAHAERQMDERLETAMRAVKTPAGLRERILKKVNRQHDLRQRRLVLRSLAAAAALLLAVGSGYWWFSSQRQEVNFHEVGVNQARFAPEGVEDFYQSQGIAMIAPRGKDFDYTFVDSCDLVDIQGVRVPHLLFSYADPGKKAFFPEIAKKVPPVTHIHVYVLSDRDFDLQQSWKSILPTMSGRYMRREKPEGNSHFLFVMVYVGPGAEELARLEQQQ